MSHFASTTSIIVITLFSFIAQALLSFSSCFCVGILFLILCMHPRHALFTTLVTQGFPRSTSERSERGDNSLFYMNSPPFYYVSHIMRSDFADLSMIYCKSHVLL